MRVAQSAGDPGGGLGIPPTRFGFPGINPGHAESTSPHGEVKRFFTSAIQ
jgi:hypothetical protein